MRWLLLSTLLCSLSVWSHPIVLKIKNTRSHSMFLISKANRQKIEIPPGTEREIVILKPVEGEIRDWELAYATGFAGAFTWNFHLTLDGIAETLEQAAGEHWKDGVLKMGGVQIVENDGVKKFALTQELAGIDATQFLEAAAKWTTAVGGILLTTDNTVVLTKLLLPPAPLPAPGSDNNNNNNNGNNTTAGHSDTSGVLPGAFISHNSEL